MQRKERESNLGYLFVVGGPGSSGSTVISKRLADRYGLKRVYAGSVFRKYIKELGYSEFEDFYSVANRDVLLEFDRRVDEWLMGEIKKSNVLIESKVFAGIATVRGVDCTVKVWLDASLHVRTLRFLGKLRGIGLLERFIKYFSVRMNLKRRWDMDRSRYGDLYGIKYDAPELYNDIVVDSSGMSEDETFNLICKEIEDGGYLKG